MTKVGGASVNAVSAITVTLTVTPNEVNGISADASDITFPNGTTLTWNADGTATLTVEIAAGSNGSDVDFKAVDDYLDEVAEGYTLSIDSVQGDGGFEVLEIDAANQSVTGEITDEGDPDENDTILLQLVDSDTAAEGGRLTAPMPGKVVSFAVQAGDAVKKGQPLAVMEAMKMETMLTAERDATVHAVHVRSGEVINAKDLLIELQ